MKILVNQSWNDSFLDQTLLPDTVRIQSLVWFNFSKLDGLYFIPAKSWRLIFNYIGEIGLRSVIRKIISRLSESARNDKYVSFGIGKVIDSRSTQFSKNDYVIFAALCHPRCQERIVLPDTLIDHYCDQTILPQLNSNYIIYADISDQFKLPECFYAYRGWSEFSGIPLPDTLKASLGFFQEIVKNHFDTLNTRKLSCSNKKINERTVVSKNNSQPKLRAGIFGYGQYAKTIILPGIHKLVDIVSIHEIDATQLPLKRKKNIVHDSSPLMRDDEHFDLCFIAGYHHTHAGLAIRALQSGTAAIIEKPIATNWHDLNALLQAMKTSQAPLFSCFHKRYHLFNDYIYQDLNVKDYDPISFHCIVFEVPLPPLHWYQWPNSGSRLLSNGCHWIDYFLYLNGFIAVKHFSLQTATNGDMHVFIELENHAVFNMTLTEIGSSRLGIREHIELRANHNTVIITDGCQYRSENRSQILRRKQVKRLSVYQTMYKNIVLRILGKMPGDSIESVEHSSSIVLLLEDCYQQSLKSPCSPQSTQQLESVQVTPA